MRKAELWEFDYGNIDVAYRADDCGYKPLVASELGWGEGDFQV
jgi:hypothetical protein